MLQSLFLDVYDGVEGKKLKSVNASPIIGGDKRKILTGYV